MILRCMRRCAFHACPGSARLHSPLFPNASPVLQLPISERTLQGLQKGTYESMKDIQTACIPHLLAGRDLMGAAKTGSGKTLAFLVPAMETLYRMGWNSLDGEVSL